MDRSVRTVLAGAVAVGALVATAAACTSDDPSAPTTSSSSSSSSSSSPSTTGAGDDHRPGVTVTASGPISLAVGERATIELEANRTTGYDWSPTAAPDTAVVATVSDTYVAPDTDRVGAGGTQRIVIEGVAPGTTTLTMGYSRPWEHDTPPARTATFDITVT